MERDFFIYMANVPHSGFSIPNLIFSFVHVPHDPGDDQVAHVLLGHPLPQGEHLGQMEVTLSF